MVRRRGALILLAGLTFIGDRPSALAQMASAPAHAEPSSTMGVLSAAEAGKLFPATVFFQEKTATVQARNAGGVRWGDQALMLVALVDASGYSSQVQEKYQAYLITEVPVLFGTQMLPAGAYGCGFLADHTFLVMDVGGHTIFHVPSQRDAAMRRPTPLQVLTDSAPGEYRLYEGRSYVAFRAAPQ